MDREKLIEEVRAIRDGMCRVRHTSRTVHQLYIRVQQLLELLQQTDPTCVKELAKK